MYELEQEINSNDEARRLYAVHDAESADSSNLARILLDRLVRENSNAVRAAITFRLKTLASEIELPELFALFRSPEAYLRNAAVGIFAGGGDRAVEFLGRHSDDSDREVRKLILDALFEIGGENAMVLIRKAMADQAVNVKVTAVEYLGQLGDESSGAEMVELLRTGPGPMLVMAILDALSRLESRTRIDQALEILAPDRDFGRIDPLYMPQLLELLAICGHGAEMIQAMMLLSDNSLYAENIVRAASTYLKGSESDSMAGPLLNRLMLLVEDDSVELEQKFQAGQTLAVQAPGRVEPETLLALGERLLDDSEVWPIGLEMMAVSSHQNARDRIEAAARSDRDPSLIEMCREYLNDNKID